jgi:MFS family permease
MSLEIHRPDIGLLTVPDFAYLVLVTMIGGFALGIGGPSSNNAAIELAPDRLSAITGMRGMFRSLGGTIGTAVIVLVTETAPSIEVGLERSFVGLAVLAVLCVPLILGIPDGVGAVITGGEAGPKKPEHTPGTGA